MKLEVYLSQGKETERLRAELYVNGFKAFGAVEVEHPLGKIVGLIGNFYDELEKGGFAKIEVELKNNGLEKEVYEEVKSQTSELLKLRLKARNAHLN